MHNVRVRDSSEKPTDQWSDNGIGRGLVTNSPTLGTRPNKVEIKIKYSYSFLNRRQNNKNSESKLLRDLGTQNKKMAHAEK